MLCAQSGSPHNIVVILKELPWILVGLCGPKEKTSTFWWSGCFPPSSVTDHFCIADTELWDA